MKTKKDIIKIYREIGWGEKIPSCCTDLEIFQCPICKRFLPIDYLCFDEFETTDEELLNDKVVCQSCSENVLEDDL